MGHKRRPTEEEYKEKKPKILELSKQGYPMLRIQNMLDITQYYLKQIREELINEGLISRGEIKAAYDRYMATNPPSQGLNKTRIRKNHNTGKEEARRAQSIARKEKTLELVKQGKIAVEIANELQVSDATISGYIKELIKEGRLSEKEIKKGFGNKKIVDIDKNNPEYIAKRDGVAELLRLGWGTRAICKHLKITSFYMNIYIRDIKEKKILTAREIEEARDQKRKQNLIDLKKTIEAGLPIDYFRATHPEFSQNGAVPLVRELIENGEVTREQVDKTGRKVANERKRKIIPPEEIEMQNRKRQERLDKKNNAIYRIKEYTMQGYTLKEIANFIGYDYTYIIEIKSKYAKENGWFTAEELKEFKKQREIREYEALPQEEKDRIEQEQKAKLEAVEVARMQKQEEILARREAGKKETQSKHQIIVELIKQYSLEGKTVIEIAEILGIRREQVYRLQKESMSNGTWITNQEAENVEQKRLERKEKEKEERHEAKAEAIEKERQEKREEEKQRKKQEMRTLMRLAMKGLSNEEMANQMHYSVAKIMVLKRTAVQEGIWFSEEEIEFYKQQRVKREAEEERKRQIEEQERQKKEQERLEQERKECEKALKEEQENLKRQEAEKRKKITAHSVEYKILRRAARNEDKLEWEGEEEVSFSARDKFTELLIELYKLGATIDAKDAEIVYNTIYMHRDFIKPKYLKFLILQASKRGGINDAEKMTTSLLTELRETKYYEPLMSYKNYLKQQKLHIEIIQLKREGLTNAQIAERLHISSAEAAILAGEIKKPPKFFEDEEIEK